MEEPPGYKTPSRGHVKQLHKAPYGLKQAGHKWYNAFSSALTNLGFCISSTDPDVFTAWINSDILVLAAHMDNCILTGSLPQLITQYKQKLNNHYALTNLGPVH
jgi:Reverse transcriptase (RNA-dependent DNA polymerase)